MDGVSAASVVVSGVVLVPHGVPRARPRTQPGQQPPRTAVGDQNSSGLGQEVIAGNEKHPSVLAQLGTFCAEMIGPISTKVARKACNVHDLILAGVIVGLCLAQN